MKTDFGHKIVNFGEPDKYGERHAYMEISLFPDMKGTIYLLLSINGGEWQKYHFAYNTEYGVWGGTNKLISGRLTNVDEDWANPTDPFRMIFVNGVTDGEKSRLHLHITKKD